MCVEWNVWRSLPTVGFTRIVEMRAISSDVRRNGNNISSSSSSSGCFIVPKMYIATKIFQIFISLILSDHLAKQYAPYSMENDCKFFCDALLRLMCVCGIYKTNRASVSLDLFMGKLFLFHICHNGQFQLYAGTSRCFAAILFLSLTLRFKMNLSKVFSK